MWWSLAFLSAVLLGFYDSFKKASLKENAVIPVLFLNTVFSTLILLPLIIRTGWGGWEVQKYILLKSCIVLSSWITGYYAMKHLPLTIVGPINATRPVMVLLGAMLIFGERLNLYQWVGVVLAAVSFFLLSRSGRKEGIDFKHNRWIALLVLAAFLGAVSGLYDRYLMAPADSGGAGLDRLQVLSWYNMYQAFMMAGMLLLLWYPRRQKTTPFRWSWTIPCISLFLCGADFLYMWALTDEAALISVVSMIRRGSVVVSFLFGALAFKEKNLKAKALDLSLVLLGMVFLYLGSR
jgi:drug/metabolite transporter (DMT)-like permease